MARQTPNARGRKPVPGPSSGQGEPSGAPLVSKRHGKIAGEIAGKAGAALPAGLHLVATPIGNLGDISRRALDTLAAADAIACEDTRVTGGLLARLGISTPLIPYHDHNADEVRPRLLARLDAGESVALVSDAGMPAIADPGYKLVRACIDGGIAVSAVPGANAALMGLVLSGLPTDRFLFEGFLPAKTVARQKVLHALAAVPATLIFYESGPRLADSLADMASVLGPRAGAVARELTKLFEEVRRGTLAELAAHYTEAGPPKGEIVIVAGPPAERAAESTETIEQMLQSALRTMSVRDAAEAVAAASGRPKREVYAQALTLSGRKNETAG